MMTRKWPLLRQGFRIGSWFQNEVREALKDSGLLGRTGRCYKRAWASSPESVKLMRRTGVVPISHEKNGFGHCIPDWGSFLEVGYGRLRKEVQRESSKVWI